MKLDHVEGIQARDRAASIEGWVLGRHDTPALEVRVVDRRVCVVTTFATRHVAQAMSEQDREGGRCRIGARAQMWRSEH